MWWRGEAGPNILSLKASVISPWCGISHRSDPRWSQLLFPLLCSYFWLYTSGRGCSLWGKDSGGSKTKSTTSTMFFSKILFPNQLWKCKLLKISFPNQTTEALLSRDGIANYTLLLMLCTNFQQRNWTTETKAIFCATSTIFGIVIPFFRGSSNPKVGWSWIEHLNAPQVTVTVSPPGRWVLWPRIPSASPSPTPNHNPSPNPVPNPQRPNHTAAMRGGSHDC